MKKGWKKLLTATVVATQVVAMTTPVVFASKVPEDIAKKNPDDVQIIRPYIKGDETVGTTLTGNYKYYDVCGNHMESGTTYQWYRSDTKDGRYTEIPEADEKNYTLTSDDVGKYIKFAVDADNCEENCSWMIGPVLSEEEKSQIHDYFDNKNDYMYNVRSLQDELKDRMTNAVYFTVDSTGNVGEGKLKGSNYLYHNNQKKEFEENTRPVVENGVVYVSADFFKNYLGIDPPNVDTNATGYYDLKKAAAKLGLAYWSGSEQQYEVENFQMQHLGQGLIVIGGAEDIFDPVKDRDLINEACNMLYTLRATDDQMKWFRDAKYGMFLHWDPSSLAGIEISWDREAARPKDIGSPYRNEIDSQYDTLYKQFNPTEYNPDEWMELAKEAGMKYVVLTTKHHGSFSNFFTDFDNYSVEYSPYKKDIVKQFVEAAHKAGLKVGFYYSPRDWYNPNYLTEDHHRYLEYYFGEIQELLTNYGNIDIMWFDSIGTSSLNQWDARTLLRRMKQLQPDLIVNNRYAAVLAGYESAPYDVNGDFYTPEHRLGGFDSTRPWESCMTVTEAPGGGWSYRPDGRIKTVEESVKYLINNVVNDGNLLYNIGPMSNGKLNEKHAQVFREVGEWLKPYEEAIYNTRGGPYINQKWGGSTYRNNEDGTQTIYLHVSPLLKNYTPENNSIQIDFASNGQLYNSAELVKDGTKLILEQNEQGYLLTLPEGVEWDKWDTVIKMNVDVGATLQNKIQEARTYTEQLTAENLAVVKKALVNAADAAENVVNKGDKEQFSEQMKSLIYELDRAKVAKRLSDTLVLVTTKIENISVGDKLWECPQSLYDRLSSEVKVGKQMLEDSASRKEDFDSAVLSMEEAFYSLEEIMDAQTIRFTPESSELETGSSFKMVSPYNELKIRYTLNGEEPTTESTLYNGEALEMSGKSLVVKAILVDADNKQIGTTQCQTYLATKSLKNIAIEKNKVEASSIYGEGYEAANAVDGDKASRWATPDGTITATLELTFDKERTVNSAIIKEYTEKREKSRISRYMIEYWDEESANWKVAYEGEEGGTAKASIFEEVTSTRFRLNILACMNVTIYEFGLYDTELGSIELVADETYLIGGNTIQLSVNGIHADGTEAGIEELKELNYCTDSEDVALISPEGVLQLAADVESSGEFNVWATANLDGRFVMSEKQRIIYEKNENFALNKRAEASTVYGTGFEAEKAIDGNDLTRWASKTKTGEQILTIDFGETTEMNQVTFRVYADRSDPLNYEVFTNFKIQYEKDGQWNDIYDSALGTHKIKYPVFNGTEQYSGKNPVWIDSDGIVKSTDYVVNFETIKTQKLRLYSNDTKKDPSIIEFAVYNIDGQEPGYSENLALNQSTTASSVYNQSYQPEKSTDGTNYTRWAAASNQEEHWLEVEFLEDTTFDAVKFEVYADAEDDELYGEMPEVLKSFFIQYWDGANWINAYDSASGTHDISYPDYSGTWRWNGSVYCGADGAVKSTDYTIDFKAVTGKKIRLYSNDTLKEPSILEFEVYRQTMEEPAFPEIVGVESIPEIIVEKGTKFSDLALPTNVEVTLNTGNKLELPVTWSEEGYDGTKAGENVLTGTIGMQGSIQNTEGYKGQVTVNVTEGPAPVDKTELNYWIAESESYIENAGTDYPAEAVDDLRKAVAEAKIIEEDENASRDNVKSAVDKLKSAVEIFKKTKKDWDGLRAVIDDIKEDVIPNLEAGMFVEDDAYRTFMELYNEAQKMLSEQKASGEDILKMEADLTEAKKALSRKANKDELKKALDQLMGMDLKGIDENLQKVVKEAVEAAQLVLDDETISEKEQNSVDAMTRAILELIETIEEKEDKPTEPTYPTEPTEPENPTEPKNPTDSNNGNGSDIPKTGDIFNVRGLIILMGCAMGIVAVVFFKRKRIK